LFPPIGKIANQKIWDVTLWQSNLTRKNATVTLRELKIAMENPIVGDDFPI
jgi:hypothetical protein